MADELEMLLGRIDDEGLRNDLTKSVNRLKRKRSFGLVFEDHLPEMVVLHQHGVRRGTKVVPIDDHEADPATVTKIQNGEATLQGDGEPYEAAADSLVAIAEFGDPIYPGFKRLGSIDRGDEKPSHIVIKGENYHALEALQFTHAGKVDCIYIDPPYNTGNRDWKYNNDYVDKEDGYRHSKWLSFMQKRLMLAQKLLNPDDSVLVVTIDEKEYDRLGLLLRQLFPNARIQMVSTLINPASVARDESFGRSDEYVYYVMFGAAAPQRVRLPRVWVSSKGRTHTGNIRWDMLRRSGDGAARADSPGGFYPIYVNPEGPAFSHIGDVLPPGVSTPPHIDGLVPVLPIRKDETEGRWMWGTDTFIERQAQGRVRIGGSEEKGFVIYVLKDGEYKKVLAGEFAVTGRSEDGSLLVDSNDPNEVLTIPGSQWRISSHDSTQYGSRMLSDSLLPDRKFPFPKSLYAVEDSIRFFVADKPDAVILDFFAGSGTTTHAVARLNKADGGRRTSIVVTNNEVSDTESKTLAKQGLRPGDPDWETLGIFEHITRPRIEAAITGMASNGNPVTGNYKRYQPKAKHCKGCKKKECDESITELEFKDDSPMAEGFAENVQFIELEYLDAGRVELDRAFDAISTLLWMRAGSVGPILDEAIDSAGRRRAYVTSDRYGVLFNPSCFRSFLDQLPRTATHVFVVTDSRSEFSHVSAALPADIEPVQLYENYLTTFAINSGGAV